MNTISVLYHPYQCPLTRLHARMYRQGESLNNHFDGDEKGEVVFGISLAIKCLCLLHVMSCCVYCCVVSVAVVWYCVVLTTGIRARSITRRYRCPTTHSPPSTVLLFDDRTRDVQLDPWDTGSGQGTGAATTHLVNPTKSIPN